MKAVESSGFHALLKVEHVTTCTVTMYRGNPEPYVNRFSSKGGPNHIQARSH
jgi:hypothetical protein